MNWFANQRTAVKLSFSFGFILFLLLCLIWFAHSAISFLENVNNNLSNLDAFELRKDLTELIHNEDEIRTSMLGVLLSPDSNNQLQYLNDVKLRTNQNDLLIRDIVNNKATNDGKMIIDKLNNIYEIHTKGRNEVSLKLIKEGKIQEAKQHELIIQKERYDELRNLATGMANLSRDKAIESVKLSATEVNKAKFAFLSISLLAISSVIAIILILNRLISTPLNQVSKTARLMALGDLKAASLLKTNRTDEVGILIQTFGEMSQWIQHMAQTANLIAKGDLTVKVKAKSEEDMLGTSFELMVKNLRAITEEIRETINLLSTSASEISAASSQLAASASEAAVSVNETTTTIEEVRQTSHVANQKAQLVSQAAENTSKISESGKVAASEINVTIDEIQNQMNLIAESMIRLSEQTQAIGLIITTVDDLSQQSNLLSVNASIEAAKAGEQGKGFAVVAQEVKSLATQSKQATNQVRAILNDIQKATSSSVMATEQGSKAVEAGVKKSEQAGESILMLVNSVADASNAAAQIAASSQQQLIGMEQATLAMENIKQTSNQNVESSKQLEISVNSIKDMGIRLKNLVEQFTFNHSEIN